MQKLSVNSEAAFRNQEVLEQLLLQLKLLNYWDSGIRLEIV